MDVIPILSTIILIATLITMIVAVASYFIFRMRSRKKSTETPANTGERPRSPNARPEVVLQSKRRNVDQPPDRQGLEDRRQRDEDFPPEFDRRSDERRDEPAPADTTQRVVRKPSAHQQTQSAPPPEPELEEVDEENLSSAQKAFLSSFAGGDGGSSGSSNNNTQNDTPFNKSGLRRFQPPSNGKRDRKDGFMGGGGNDDSIQWK
ncbi:hypothetical protein K8I28_05685 [bacterium]|nr:hypothetical protein [bacterium]